MSSCPSPLHLGTALPDQRRQFLNRKLASERVPMCPGPSRCAPDYIRWPDRQTLSSPQGPSPSPSLSCRPSHLGEAPWQQAPPTSGPRWLPAQLSVLGRHLDSAWVEAGTPPLQEPFSLAPSGSLTQYLVQIFQTPRDTVRSRKISTKCQVSCLIMASSGEGGWQ